MYKYIELKTLDDVKAAVAAGLNIEFEMTDGHEDWYPSGSATSNGWSSIQEVLDTGGRYRAKVEMNPASEVGLVELDSDGNPIRTAEDYLLNAISRHIKDATGMFILLDIKDLADEIPTKVALKAINDAIKELRRK